MGRKESNQTNKSKNLLHMSRDMGFPTMFYVRPTKPQINLHIHAVWSEPLLVAWIFYECWSPNWTSFVVSKLKRRLHRLVWVYTCRNATLLGITCRGSNVHADVSSNFGLSLHLHPYQVYSSIEGSGDTVHGCLDLSEPWPLAISISVKILCAGPYKYVAYQYRTG